ncbi:peptidase M16 domain-containing protein [Anabaenopsis circularis NIES-21]|uniref:Peptidase M16 domain-containing protein n=1 Tax=Anabaenopsis circularis NIES-21 TaxID=1085406 RepID=A0A1Z4GHB2_9CYAN|nr:peptidase M16 domain-containing protein [Anabaenopsis circularis NIES-21]
MLLAKLKRLIPSAVRLRWLLAILIALTIIFWKLVPEVAVAQIQTASPPQQPLQKSKTQTQPVSSSIQPYLDQAIKRVTEFRLDNGLKFIVFERHQAPVISFVTYADVGAVDEPDGKTGMAHFLEHLAFKGTTRIGTTDYKAEKPLLDRLEQLNTQIKAAKADGKQDEVAQLQAEFEQVESQAAKLVKENEFIQIVSQAGGDLNAYTYLDKTVYPYVLPANKLELWMSLESERFLEPEFRREFYKERDVILEERRLRVENSPTGMMGEKFLDTAFKVHPYRRPGIGYEKDIRNLTPKDVQEFFDTHYIPSNLTISIVGDVNPTEVKQLAQIYFGRYPAKPKPIEEIPVEPPQAQIREVTLRLPSQPLYWEGYHRPAVTHPDNAVYDIIGSLLWVGPTSRLYKSLVEQQQLASDVDGDTNTPDNKYPNLIVFLATTASGHTIDELAAALEKEIDKLKTEPVSATELQRVKTQIRAALLDNLNSNMGMARRLSEYEAKTGSWRNSFKYLDEIAAVTPADIQRVTKATFTAENRTIGKLLSQ